MNKPNIDIVVSGAKQAECTYKNVVLKGNHSFASQLTKPNCIYTIKWDFDLGGEEVTIPENCVLEFDGGSIKNGIIVGNNTVIVAIKTVIFAGIVISGTWNVAEIFSDWFDGVTSDNVSRQLFNLTNESTYNRVVFEKGIYNVSASDDGECVFIPKSNTDIILEGDIVLTSSTYDNYNIFEILRVDNVSVSGSGKIIGDKDTHIMINSDQAGMGIRIRNSRNITIDGIFISKCWADGIYIGAGSNAPLDAVCNKIQIKNCEISYCGRQGISFTHSTKVLVDNSYIHDIGKAHPSSCIDIEANIGNINKIIEINNCVFDNSDRCLIVNGAANDSETEEIAINNCKFTMTGATPSGETRFINSAIFLKKAEKVTLNNSYVYTPNTGEDENVEPTGGIGLLLRDNKELHISDSTIVSGGFAVIVERRGDYILTVQNCNLTGKYIQCYNSSFNHCNMNISEEFKTSIETAGGNFENATDYANFYDCNINAEDYLYVVSDEFVACNIEAESFRTSNSSILNSKIIVSNDTQAALIGATNILNSDLSVKNLNIQNGNIGNCNIHSNYIILTNSNVVNNRITFDVAAPQVYQAAFNFSGKSALIANHISISEPSGAETSKYTRLFRVAGTYADISNNYIENVRGYSISPSTTGTMASKIHIDANTLVGFVEEEIDIMNPDGNEKTYSGVPFCVPEIGTTRPSLRWVGLKFFDITPSINKPIWYVGNDTWIDATGTEV